MRVTGVSTPTRPFRDNEDWLGSGPGVVVVLDGCGQPDNIAEDTERGCAHGLPWYVKTLGTAVLRSAGDLATPLDDALATAIAETATAHHGRCDLHHPSTPASTVVILRENRRTVEYLVLGDSTIAIDDGSPEPIVVTDDREIRIPFPSIGSDEEQAKRNTREYMAVVEKLRNQPDGFPIAAADPQAAYRALAGHLGTEQVRRAIVASDGATRLVDRFGILTWTELLDLASSGGPEEVINQTRTAETTDLECKKWPRGRAHDDATLALCVF
ncbi:hypothetical protein [Stackebrandtia nassauensis]|uniref:Protein phosphatase 2C-like protein n=1 Tax=Stackebrandtia nassauensis (strain DSM 44728 / CIP 108903 / NRRL B-16338 / NBRC 102104 / LLR-40K-21) TaxID=446470 RepID=D3Q4C6_STANL|nr:hypothetical protein [Stackebrandtia nassauensis]ADD40086.1 hypothetical protein Snas_0369 [Stackebrandtia nassauensis DSM 44728]